MRTGSDVLLHEVHPNYVCVCVCTAECVSVVSALEAKEGVDLGHISRPPKGTASARHCVRQAEHFFFFLGGGSGRHHLLKKHCRVPRSRPMYSLVPAASYPLLKHRTGSEREERHREGRTAGGAA